MQVSKLKRLTDTEFQGLVGTELYARLMSNKYEVAAADNASLHDGLEMFCRELQDPWYLYPAGVQGYAVLYVSSKDDVTRVESL